MAAQTIFIPEDLFDVLSCAWWSLPQMLKDISIDVTAIGFGKDKCLAVSAPYSSAGLNSRPLGREEVVGLVIAPEGTDIKSMCWPRPLPEAGATWLIDNLLATVEGEEGLTAHDRVAIAGYLEAAKADPETGPRPPEPGVIPEALLTTAQCLSNEFQRAIRRLSRSIESYRVLLGNHDCTESLLSLSCQMHLGRHVSLLHRTGDRSEGDGLHALDWSEFRKELDAAQALADATLSALRTYDPYHWSYVRIERIQQVAGFHSDLSPTVPRLRYVPRWRLFDNSFEPEWSVGEGPARLSSVSPHAVSDAMTRWLAHMQVDPWPGVHPLVRALVLHVGFLQISPFRDANAGVARLLLAIEFQKLGWPPLPLEAAIAGNWRRYAAALRTATEGDHSKFLGEMIRTLRSAIGVGTKLIPVIEHHRIRLIELLRDPRLLGPDTHSRCLREWADAVLRDVFFEGVARDETGAIVDALHQLGALRRSWVGKRAVYSVPAIATLVARLSRTAVPGPARAQKAA